LASKLCGWDIEIMTQEELEKQIEKAVAGFGAITGVTEELANRLVGEGYLSYDDLSVIEPTDLQEMGGLSEDEVDSIVEQAEVLAEQAERMAKENPPAQSEKKLFSGRYDQPASNEPAAKPVVAESSEAASSEAASLEAAAEHSATEPAAEAEVEAATGETVSPDDAGQG
jgi:N utilization substance protein A